MKKITMLCITLSFLVMPISIFANDGSVQKISKLEKKMKILTDKIDNIVTNSRKAREISEKYKKIATKHLSVVSDFTAQKGDCQNLESIYEKRKQQKNLDYRVKRKQAGNIVECYKSLEGLIYDFENMSRAFSKLKNSIGILNDMSETDQAIITSLSNQAKSLEGLIQLEKSNAILSRQEVEDAIKKLSN